MSTAPEICQVAAHLGRASLTARGALLGIKTGLEPPDLTSQVQSVVDSLGEAMRLLVSIGAADVAPAPEPESFSLAALAALESVRPDAQALAQALRALLPLAERIDAARGRSLPAPVAGSAGLDLAEDLVQLLARVEMDLYGPGAALTGARE